MRRIRTICRCCSASCGIVVERDGEQILSVRGDPEHPRSRGYICPKGASLPAFHHRDDILRVPRLRGVDVDWTTCLDDLARGLAGLLGSYGPDSVAVYQGTGAVGDTFGLRLTGRFIASIGSGQFYSAATVDVAPAMRAAELVSGSAELLPVWRPEDANSHLAIFIGFNPFVSHGYITILPDPQRRLAAFRARGGRIWTVDPRATKSAAASDGHLAIRPGRDAALLAWLLRALLEDGADRADYEAMTTAADRAALRAAVAAFDLETAAALTGVAADALLALLADIRRAGRIGIVAGTGVTLGRHGLLTEWLRWALLIVTGSLDREGGMWFNPGWLNPVDLRRDRPETPPEGWLGPGPKSRPELPRLLGQTPCVALVDEIEAGNIRALIVSGASPLTAFPEPERLAEAFRRLDILATIDIVETPLTAMASHVLAATGQLERTDIVTETSTMIAPAVVPPIGARKPMWWIFGQLAARLGKDVLDGASPDTATEEGMLRALAGTGRGDAETLLNAGPDGVMPPVEYGWVRRTQLPDGRWRLVPPGLAARLSHLLAEAMDENALRLVSSRQLARVNATQYVPPRKSRDLPHLHIHPRDAERYGLGPGDRAWVSSPHGRIRAVVRPVTTLRLGVVSLSHGWHEPNLGHLTSSRIGVDPLTAQPEMTAIPVKLERVPADHT